MFPPFFSGFRGQRFAYRAMGGRGTPFPLFSQDSCIKESQTDMSQEGLWAEFLALAKAKGPAWAQGFLDARRQDDSGVEEQSASEPQAITAATETRASKRKRKLTNKEFPPAPPPPKETAASVTICNEPTSVPLVLVDSVADLENVTQMGKVMDQILGMMTIFQKRLDTIAALPQLQPTPAASPALPPVLQAWGSQVSCAPPTTSLATALSPPAATPTVTPAAPGPSPSGGPPTELTLSHTPALAREQSLPPPTLPAALSTQPPSSPAVASPAKVGTDPLPPQTPPTPQSQLHLWHQGAARCPGRCLPQLKRGYGGENMWTY